jgi:putative membrane protein
MKRILIATSMMALALSACSKSGTETAADNSSTEIAAGNSADAATIETTGSPASIGANGASMVSTPKFVESAAISDMFEIASSKLALTRATSPDIKAFAKAMISAHEGTTAALKKTLATANAGVTPPTAMDERHTGMLDELQKSTPDKFDSKYLDQQTQAHREALGLMDSYATHGDNAALKALAGETKPKIQMHLDMVSKLDHGGADNAAKDGATNTM